MTRPMRPVVGGDPWRELTAEEKRRLPMPARSYPPRMPGPIVGDYLSPEHARAIADYETWRDRDLAA